MTHVPHAPDCAIKARTGYIVPECDCWARSLAPCVENDARASKQDQIWHRMRGLLVSWSVFGGEHP